MDPPESAEYHSALYAIEYSGHSLSILNIGKRIKRSGPLPGGKLCWYVGVCECGSSSALEPTGAHAKIWHANHLKETLRKENLAWMERNSP